MRHTREPKGAETPALRRIGDSALRVKHTVKIANMKMPTKPAFEAIQHRFAIKCPLTRGYRPHPLDYISVNLGVGSL